MAVKFSPNGNLDIATDPSELPSQGSNGDEISGAMRRCTNLHLDRMGIASTRKGSSLINASPISESTIYRIVELAGNRYIFAGDQIFKDETSIATGYYEAPWSSIIYNAFNSASEQIFALNGVDTIRIQGSTVNPWGVPAPTLPPFIISVVPTGLTGSYNAKFSYVRKEGTTVVYETNTSDAAATFVTLSNKSLRIICQHDQDDTQVTHLRVYRNMATDTSRYYYDGEITLPTNVDYAYTFGWENANAHIAGDGFNFAHEVSVSSSSGYSEKRYFSTGTDSKEFGQTYKLACQGFKPAGNFTCSSVGVSIKSVGSPSEITVRLYSSSGGKPDTLLATGYIQATDVGTDYAWKYVIFDSAVALVSGTLYWLRLSVSAADYSNYYKVQGYFSYGSNHFGDSDEVFKHGDSNSTVFAPSSIWDMNFKTLSYAGTTTGIKNITYDWEEDYNTASTINPSTNTYWHEPGLYVSLTADTALGTEEPSDHDIPPLGTFTFGPSFNGTCFILKDNLMYYCKPKQPEYWPTNYYLEMPSISLPLKSGCLFNGQVYVASTNEIYLIQGSGHSSWSPPLNMSAITGTISKDVFLPVAGMGIFHLGYDGLYLFNGTTDENITNSMFKQIFDGETVEDIPGVNKTYMSNCWLILYKAKLYFGYPSGSAQYPTDLIVTDIKTSRSVHYDYSQILGAITVDQVNDRLIAVDTSGYVWKIEDPDVATDNGTAISWDIKSKEYSDQLRKYFPRWARYDVTIGTGATANGYIILNGTSKQTHSLTTSRKTKKRLITGCTGDRIAIQMSGTGAVDIYACEVE